MFSEATLNNVGYVNRPKHTKLLCLYTFQPFSYLNKATYAPHRVFQFYDISVFAKSQVIYYIVDVSFTDALLSGHYLTHTSCTSLPGLSS